LSRRPKVLSLQASGELLTAAEKQLERWQSESADLLHAAEVLAADLVEAQARAADDVLDDEDPSALSRVAQALTAKQAEQELAVQAARRAADRLSGVHREVLKARGAAVRSRAVELQNAAAARQARTDQMLAELAEFEAVQFGPVARADVFGVVAGGFTPRTLTQQLAARAQWLLDHAAGQEHLAEHGSDVQVAGAVAAGLPPVDDVERVSALTAAAV
jgi:hypothetical protein